ncbi:MAG: hypothetical protein MMC23_007356 [Stictis urceolatum]|nr:hypothetical protein [Stictis urceolata]
MATVNGIKPSAPPELNIPPSDSTVKVSIIDSTTRIEIPAEVFLTPKIEGHDILKAPAYSFLIENVAKSQKILFDLGVRKDWENMAPSVVDRIKSSGWKCSVGENISDILTENHIPLSSITSIIWSHHHFDHTGDPSTFPPSTSLVVGPGFKSHLLPAYPTNPSSGLLESSWSNRSLQEISFSTDLKLGRFSACDFFGDGSFYLLDSPGHAIGHMCGLARTTGGGTPSFIFMGGDAAHHAGEFRPTEYLPIPKEIRPSPYVKAQRRRVQESVCPGEVFEGAHPRGRTDEAFYQPSEGIASDLEEAKESIRKMEEFDASGDVLSVMAHDDTLLDLMEFFPEEAGGWREKGWRGVGLWRFLGDFRTGEGKGQAG